MQTPYEYRAQAREALQGRWGEAAIVSLIILVTAVLISVPSIVAEWAGSLTTVLSVLVLPLQYAYYISLLERTRGSEEELTRFTLQYAINQAYANTRFLVAGLLIMLLYSGSSLHFWYRWNYCEVYVHHGTISLARLSRTNSTRGNETQPRDDEWTEVGTLCA